MSEDILLSVQLEARHRSGNPKAGQYIMASHQLPSDQPASCGEQDPRACGANPSRKPRRARWCVLDTGLVAADKSAEVIVEMLQASQNSLEHYQQKWGIPQAGGNLLMNKGELLDGWQKFFNERRWKGL